MSSRSVSGDDDVAVAICSGVGIRVDTCLEMKGTAGGVKEKVVVRMERNAGTAIRSFIVFCFMYDMIDI